MSSFIFCVTNKVEAVRGKESFHNGSMGIRYGAFDCGRDNLVWTKQEWSVNSRWTYYGNDIVVRTIATRQIWPGASCFVAGSGCDASHCLIINID